MELIWLFRAITIFLALHFSRCNAELITALPGQPPNVSFQQHSGYVVTDAQNGRALFYYFVEADSPNPLSRPLTLWLNGGPGCSSLGFGAFMETGPFQPGEDGVLSKNKYSWNLESNMLYLESPIGVGFSYSNTSSDYNMWNDTKAAEDNLMFIINWLEEFPMYKGSDFFIAGESYAGHYAPQLAALILEHNKQPNIKPINLKAIALGNPLLDIDISVQAGDYLWSHGVISDETLFLEKTVCNDSKYWREIIQSNVSKECNNIFIQVIEEMGYVEDANILSSICLSPINISRTAQLKPMGILGEIHETFTRSSGNAGDPCLVYRIYAYLNRPDVQRALHANTTDLPYKWAFCEAGPLNYSKLSLGINIIPLVSELILTRGLPVLLFSGDQDSKIPLTQTRIIANKIAKDLKLLTFTNYGTWYDDKQVGGWSQSFGGVNKQGKNETYLTFATVRGGAHEVPFTSPSQALTLFHSFLNGIPLPGPPSNP